MNQIWNSIHESAVAKWTHFLPYKILSSTIRYKMSALLLSNVNSMVILLLSMSGKIILLNAMSPFIAHTCDHSPSVILNFFFLLVKRELWSHTLVLEKFYFILPGTWFTKSHKKWSKQRLDWIVNLKKNDVMIGSFAFCISNAPFKWIPILATSFGFFSCFTNTSGYT